MKRQKLSSSHAVSLPDGQLFTTAAKKVSKWLRKNGPGDIFFGSFEFDPVEVRRATQVRKEAGPFQNTGAYATGWGEGEDGELVDDTRSMATCRSKALLVGDDLKLFLEVTFQGNESGLHADGDYMIHISDQVDENWNAFSAGLRHVYAVSPVVQNCELQTLFEGIGDMGFDGYDGKKDDDIDKMLGTTGRVPLVIALTRAKRDSRA
eukprot:gnl/TRDRNA2_/TRDRNA2_187467_c0_seq1.p1 gnl/TRDRNA2_/TRDRNA2_187467_c0~~gnl/TRDRNA2_/TRDRNA2_187467_c0_seq1.p1  ORF type:complete len:207 (+),score=31.14 gnl/TRDRNA2_/TRDRNA2_187467_c0_seq1:67-687(+)